MSSKPMKDFINFIRNFYRVSSLVQGVMLVLLMLILLGALVISWAEGLGLGTSLYFALVTATTIGYGDISPTTVSGRIASVMLGIIGLVYFGLVVAISTRALQDTVTKEGEANNKSKVREQEER